MNDRQESVAPENLLREDETLDGAAILRLLDKPLSADDLRDATERVARPLELAEKDISRLLVFQVGDELMAFDALHVTKVTRSVDVHRIPHRSNKVIRGLCNLDGELLLCGDLARLLDLDEREGASLQPESQRRMIVLGSERNRWVIEVDAVRGVATAVRNTFRRPPITVDITLTRHTTHLVPMNALLVALLDVDGVASGVQGALR